MKNYQKLVSGIPITKLHTKDTKDTKTGIRHSDNKATHEGHEGHNDELVLRGLTLFWV